MAYKFIYVKCTKNNKIPWQVNITVLYLQRTGWSGGWWWWQMVVKNTEIILDYLSVTATKARNITKPLMIY